MNARDFTEWSSIKKKTLFLKNKLAFVILIISASETHFKLGPVVSDISQSKQTDRTKNLSQNVKF